MPATFLDGFPRSTSRLTGKHHGAALHIGAEAELPELCEELFQRVKCLDGLNLLRFQNDPKKRAARLAARDMSWLGLGETVVPAPDIKPAA